MGTPDSVLRYRQSPAPVPINQPRASHGLEGPACLPLPRAKERPVRPDRAPSRAPPRPDPPGRSPLPARAPRPSLPLSAAAVGPGGRRGRRRAGAVRSLAALWAARLSGWTSRLAPCAPRRSRSRLCCLRLLGSRRRRLWTTSRRARRDLGSALRRLG